MTTTIDANFDSDGTTCAAWLTYPDGPGPHPAVVLIHGLGATHHMMLKQYEQAFSAAGIATLAFDYRTTGASAGSPRQRLSMRRQHADAEHRLRFPHVRRAHRRAASRFMGHQPGRHARAAPIQPTP